MRAEAIQNPGLYLFACPSIKLIREQAKKLREEAESIGVILRVDELDHKASGSGSVQTRLDASLANINSQHVLHAALFITHESLMGLDLSGFGGWHARIDEAPNAVQSGYVNVPASVGLLKQRLSLRPVGTKGWAEIVPSDDQSGWRDLANDDLLKSLSELLKQAERDHGVFVDSTTWKKSMGWCSVWLPAALHHFASVQIAGASYYASLGAIIAKKHLSNAINFTTRDLPMNRTGFPDINIHYFTRSHESNTELWKTSIGRYNITKICDFLVITEPQLGFWSGNEQVRHLMEHRLHGEPLSPRVAGLNEYFDRTSCAFIYSSKPQKGDRPVMDLFDISPEEVRRAREEEDVLQFIMRGAIRMPDFHKSYDVYVYSKKQAEVLERQLLASSVGSVLLKAETNVGIMDADPYPEKTLKNAIAAGRATARRGKRP